MIRRVEVRNFKKFKAMDLDLAERQVVVGPNNCGKTTMVQSISMCCEVADYWLRRPSPFLGAGRSPVPHPPLCLRR